MGPQIQLFHRAAAAYTGTRRAEWLAARQGDSGEAALDKWRHLFLDGEYAPRKEILADLTLEQVTFLPSAVSHSIYDELWHLTTWQRVIAFRDEELYGRWAAGERYPGRPPASERVWHALVDEFFVGLERVLTWTNSPEKLDLETDPGITMADNLASLAVHNAYHLGKIVAIRQMLGAWPPDVMSSGTDDPNTPAS